MNPAPFPKPSASPSLTLSLELLTAHLEFHCFLHSGLSPLAQPATVPTLTITTLHVGLNLPDQLIGLGAVEQGPDGGEGIQDDGLGVGLDVLLESTACTLWLGPGRLGLGVSALPHQA